MYCTKVTAYIIFKDGTSQISEHNLVNHLSFALSEMRSWIKENSKKPIKKIVFIKKFK
jgi:hypothetical protein